MKAITLIIIAFMVAIYNTRKVKGLTRIGYIIPLAMLYFFILTFFTLLSGEL